MRRFPDVETGDVDLKQSKIQIRYAKVEVKIVVWEEVKYCADFSI